MWSKCFGVVAILVAIVACIGFGFTVRDHELGSYEMDHIIGRCCTTVQPSSVCKVMSKCPCKDSLAPNDPQPCDPQGTIYTWNSVDLCDVVDDGDKRCFNLTPDIPCYAEYNCVQDGAVLGSKKCEKNAQESAMICSTASTLYKCRTCKPALEPIPDTPQHKHNQECKVP